MPDKRQDRKEAPPEAGDDAVQTSQDAYREVGGRKGPEPTRFGDWEKNGIASDF